MKISSSQLLSELKSITSDNIVFVEELLPRSEGDLNYRISDDSWSIMECIEHLNRYGNFYIPEINQRILLSRSISDSVFISGLLGNYFAKSMYPKIKVNKMKTFKNMNPIHSRLNKDVLTEFIKQQNHLFKLLDHAQNVSLNKIKTSISISTLIKLRLGDTFRFVIYHNLRHIEQAKRVLNSINGI
ncbi:DinB family protein [Chryseobacterium sp. MYb264]|uniref:DinB family protein n=1 Tax=Chryseobacterium sp. MYb264 TaxID=2745153 RepID=UPI002E109D18|nr:DinB family protein [Chryseobacterium sp. MYb264]